jgi:hypothetical protein
MQTAAPLGRKQMVDTGPVRLCIGVKLQGLHTSTFNRAAPTHGSVVLSWEWLTIFRFRLG